MSVLLFVHTMKLNGDQGQLNIVLGIFLLCHMPIFWWHIR